LQEKQDSKSELFVNLPWLQSEQPPLSVTKNPAKQARHVVLPVDFVSRPVAHVGHDVLRSASADAVPIAQASQASRVTPSVRPYLPGKQGRQADFPGSG
jgi:hypothetical protein